MFRKVLVANRGEIAVRVIRALRELGIRSAAVYSDADRPALHVRLADEAYRIGPAPSSESYLRIEAIIDAARSCGADAIHPGYGFLSERADFASTCEEAGIRFIGPPASAMRAMASKTAARRLAIEADVPVVPGIEHAINDTGEAHRIAARLGYPVMLKASAGGGGKGMRLVENEAGLLSALRDASSEAERAFGDGSIYLEKAIVRPRHIEIQVLADGHGHAIHLGERECSLQRRHQKIIEECPSPLVTSLPHLREQMGAAAVRIAKTAGYVNAGTVEFLSDSSGNFYFLEMNTRLQVEHPVTEIVTGLDLVHWQIRIAAGEQLTINQANIAWRGHSVECRIYAEDPDNGFFPSPGRIAQLAEPAGPGVRVDTGVYPGWTIPIEYDPLLAKLISYGGTREEAAGKMARALSEYAVGGITTNIAFVRELIESEAFRSGNLHTGIVDEFLASRSLPELSGEGLAPVALIAGIHTARTSSPNAQPPSRWADAGRGEQMR